MAVRLFTISPAKSASDGRTGAAGGAEGAGAAAGVSVNSKNAGSYEAFRYAARPKPIGPRFGKTLNPRRARFGKRGAGRILPRRGR